jgi:D-beta-D-heptose 7-phosphate kinase/D-beta-D-heptose 1-phosphate adenosyltransferase
VSELTPERAEELVRTMAGRRVVVVGDIMVDHFIWGDVIRISPEAPVPVVKVTRESFHPGGCGNVAANLAVLGAIPLVVAPVSRDAAAATLREEMDRRGIAPAYLVEARGRVTTKKTRIVAHQQQVVRFDREADAELSPEEEAGLIAAAREQMEGADGLVISDYDKGAITPRLLEELLPEARRRDLVVTVDPKRKPFSVYRPATLVTPNLSEAENAVGFSLRDEGGLLRGGRSLRDQLGSDGLLLTRGERGMSLFESGDRVTHIPATAREVFDVTGAGDTVVATAVLTLAAGGTLREAAELANRAAGIAIGKLGTGTVAPRELMEYIEGAGSSGPQS